MKPGLRPVLLVLVAGALVWFVSIRGPESTPGIVHARTSASAVSSRTNHPAQTPETLPEALNAAPEGAHSGTSVDRGSGTEGGSELLPATVLENLRSVFHDYAARFGGNPVGTNPEITARLNGGNPKQVVFLRSEDGMRINERGELVDNWGTPYFFHQLSGTEMEIHSAGPDHKMWTADDLVIR